MLMKELYGPCHTIFSVDAPSQSCGAPAHCRLTRGGLERRRQYLDRKPPAWDRPWSDPERGNTSDTERLVKIKRQNHPRHTRPQSRRRRTCATMMNHHRDAREEPIMRHFLDLEDAIGQSRIAHTAPARQQHATLPQASE